jgi:hypothetical protein
MLTYNAPPRLREVPVIAETSERPDPVLSVSGALDFHRRKPC